jgi:AcrR family transcriptional regulator
MLSGYIDRRRESILRVLMARATPTTPTTTRASAGNSVSRRDEILEFAAGVIAERGIKDATVRDIGEAAGILSGSLYYHFDSKEQIVLELLKPSTDENYARAVAICAEYRGAAALAELIRNAVRSTAENPVRSVIRVTGANRGVSPQPGSALARRRQGRDRDGGPAGRLRSRDRRTRHSRYDPQWIAMVQREAPQGPRGRR